ncbi:hypothetical protein ETI08_03575 [Macrococcoides goetzii]|nr:hypothetical protein [Macrococcus goetzii]TDM48231.1 hypothetical protein ETI08_03575 [Macrococcus goetzii]
MIDKDDLRQNKIMTVKHVKTGNIYRVAISNLKIINTTNGAEGQEMIFYGNKDLSMEFVKEINEFCDGRFVVHEYFN